MEANKSECEKCIKIAQIAINNKNNEKAIKFLTKALRLYPNELAKELLDKLENDNENTNNNNNNSSSQNDDKKSTPQSSPQQPRRRVNSTNNNEQENNQQHSSTSSSNDYTRDQLDAVKRIKNCRDFYEVLGVPKTASESDLKKSYKKLALQFHPDKNKAPGATDAFKAIGKAFAVLSDSQKRKHYDTLGPEAFDSGSSSTTTTRRHANMRRNSSSGYTYYTNNSYWSDDDFSAEEIFNMFFGAGFANNAAANRHRNYHNNNSQNSYVFTNSNNYAMLFQLLPILLIVVLSLLSSLMVGEPLYSLSRTNKYGIRRTTEEHQVVYYVKSDFKIENSNELRRLEKQVEDDLLIDLRQNCYRERSYKETALWRARTYGDERLLKRANDMETPSCERINKIFGGG